MSAGVFAERRPFDRVLIDMADYATAATIDRPEAYQAARLCLMDSLGCAFLALAHGDCTKLLGPVVPQAVLPGGARVPGTAWELDPVQAAFNIGTMVRWLDYNDAWLAAEWGHPSDNLGAILACADWLSRQRGTVPIFVAGRHKNGTVPFAPPGQEPLRVRDVLTSMIKAYELQGVLALENAFNRVGLDHVILVRVASTMVAATLLGGSREQVLNALSNAWIDGGCLRTYRHAPDTGSRKSWAAGDATSRGVWLALLTLRGEMGYPSALSAPTWGFCDALFRGRPLRVAQPYASHVIENVLLKVAYPAEFHAQTAAEAAVRLHPQVRGRIHQIERVCIETQESAARIIDKRGPLRNPADRDHCLQYVVAVALLEGALSAESYRDEYAEDPRIDSLRAKMEVVVNPDYSRDYLDPAKRSIANAVQVFFADGSATERVEVEYPLGHPRRRAESLPQLQQKFRTNLAARLPSTQCQDVMELFLDQRRLESLPVDQFMAMLVVSDE